MEPSLVVASPTVSWSRLPLMETLPRSWPVMESMLPTLTRPSPVALSEHGEGEVGVLDAAGAEIKSLATARRGRLGGEHEIDGG